LSPNQRAFRRFLKNRLAVASAAYLALVVLGALLWPWLSSFGGTAISELQSEPPNAKHFFGTDEHGRDLLTRVAEGTRVSLLVGLVGAGVSLFIGVTWGAVAGYLGGKVDEALMRVVDILYSLPSIIFVIVLITTLEAYLKGWLDQMFNNPALSSRGRLLFLFVGLGAVSWLTMARIVRGQVLSLRNRPFVEASRALGAGKFHIIRKHILPNVYGVILAYLALSIPSIILYESFLSYLGLGIQPPEASLGSLIASGAVQINPIQIYWWMVFFPGAALATTLLALNFLGDGLRDAMDPRSWAAR